MYMRLYGRESTLRMRNTPDVRVASKHQRVHVTTLCGGATMIGCEEGMRGWVWVVCVWVRVCGRKAERHEAYCGCG